VKGNATSVVVVVVSKTMLH